MTCDNICQRNVANKTLYDMKITNNWKKDNKNVRAYKGHRWYRTWKIKTNDELNKLIGNYNIINYIKAQRLSWFAHVRQMEKDRMVKKLCE